MPFGSRLSSVYMQRMAQFIQRAVLRQGVLTIIYLDDILVICPKSEDPTEKFDIVMTTVRELGLPIAWEKIVTPTSVIRFLGIVINLEDREIRIPEEKIASFLTLAKQTVTKTFISRKSLQSIAGHINHLSKGVKRARLFMNQILESLRHNQNGPIRVDDRFRKDINWFICFLSEFYGRIVPPNPTHTIEADSCLSGGGGRMGNVCYSYVYPGEIADKMHISQLEAYNCVIACKVLLEDRSDLCVKIVCDNESAIASFNSGRGRDPVITAMAREFWFFSASYNIEFQFCHAPGESMEVADALSRCHLSPTHEQVAVDIIKKFDLVPTAVLPHHVSCNDFI